MHTTPGPRTDNGARRRRLAPLLALALCTACSSGQDGKQPPATKKTKRTNPPGPPPPAPDPEPEKKRGRAPVCDDAAAPLDAFLRAANAGTPTPEALTRGYKDAALQRLVKAADKDTGRSDDAATLTAITGVADAKAPEDRRAQALTAAASVRASLGFWLRGLLAHAANAEKTRAERRQAWDTADCVWSLLSHSLRPGDEETTDAGAGPGPGDTPPPDAVIREAFVAGRRGLLSAAEREGAGDKSPTDDPRETLVLPARQRVEKSYYRLAHRRLQTLTRIYKGTGAPLDSLRADHVFALIEDRLREKNTPGIATIRGLLAQKNDVFDPAAVLRELNVAFAKRTRKYCSDAIDKPDRPIAERTASATEGATYVRLILPDMATRLAAEGFDAAAHLGVWDAYVQELDAGGEDHEELARLSAELVRWNCAYQKALAIVECTSTADEKPT